MKKTDGRKLSHEALEAMRIQAVKAVIQRKQSPERVIAAFGFHRSCIYEWIKAYRQGGYTALDFLKRLLATVPGNITLIVDGHPVHKRKKVQEFIKNTNGRIKIYFLPPYSPELNPDEQVWGHTKPLIHSSFPKSKKEFITQIKHNLHRLQKLPNLLISFFSHPDVDYVTQI